MEPKFATKQGVSAAVQKIERGGLRRLHVGIGARDYAHVCGESGERLLGDAPV
jgi:hypothetical protein